MMSEVEADDANKGLADCGSFTSRSKLVEMTGHIYSDIFSQEKILLNHVMMRIKLIRSPDAFSIMAGGANPHI